MLPPNHSMASTRKSPPGRRQRESQRLTLKVQTVSPPPRGAGERRRSTPHVELEVPEALRPKRPDTKLTVNVVDVVTADLTKDPRHEK
jgi:hypothetical protein